MSIINILSILLCIIIYKLITNEIKEGWWGRSKRQRRRDRQRKREQAAARAAGLAQHLRNIRHFFWGARRARERAAEAQKRRIRARNERLNRERHERILRARETQRRIALQRKLQAEEAKRLADERERLRLAEIARIAQMKRDKIKAIWVNDQKWVPDEKDIIPYEFKKHYSKTPNNEVTYSELHQHIPSIPDYIPGDTKCVYTYIPPQISNTYNIDFKSPYARYSDTENNLYYTDNSFSVNMDVTTNVLNNVFPYSNEYEYCQLDKGLPSCSVFTCGLTDKEHLYKVGEKVDSSYKKAQEISRANLYSKRKKNSDLFNSQRNIQNSYINTISKF